MLALYRSLSYRYFRLRWDRTGLIVASIALGVATLVSTRLINQCIEFAARQSTSPAASKDVHFFVGSGEAGVRRDLAEAIRRVPGVARAEPLLVERVQLPDLDNRPVLLGAAELTAGALGDNLFGFKFTFTRTPNPFGMPSVLLGRAIVEERRERGIADDAPLKARAGGKLIELRPVGIVDAEGPAAALGRNILGMEISQAAQVVQKPGLVTRIDVVLGPNADHDAAREAVERVVAGRAQVRTQETQGQEAQEVISGIQIGFSLCGAGALVVGLFLVYNALSVNVTERRHDIGVLRSLGATRWQVAALFTGEATLLGVIGAVLGVPLGVVLANVGLEKMAPEMAQLFLTGPGQSIPLHWPSIATAMLAGIGTAVLATLIPAIQAAADEPADAVRRVPTAAAGFYKYLQGSVCLLFVVGGLLSFWFRDVIPNKFGIYASPVLALLGMLMGLPLVVGVLARVLQPITRATFGLATRLAGDNLTRAPGRTGVVIGALAAGVGLMFQIAGVGHSNEAPVLDWIERAVTADMILLYGDPGSATASTLPMDPSLGDELRRLPGVETVVSVRYSRPEFNGKIIFMVAIDAADYYAGQRKSSHMPNLDLFPKLREPDTVLVSDNFAAKHRLGPGDTMTLQSPDGPVTLKIIGTIQDYSWAQGTILMDRARYAERFSDRLIDTCHVYLRDGEGKSAAWAGVEKFAESRGLNLMDRDQLRGYVRDVIDRIYQLAYLQQVVVGIVAALGVVMALLISILQRRRELGTLRALGSTQGQVLRSVLAEAVLMGVFGTVLGLLIGLPLEWYILHVVVFEESGFWFPILIPWREALGIGVIGVALAALAGLGPAIHAVRLNIAEAIAYE
jgi:putative ABC transport system permease protein